MANENTVGMLIKQINDSLEKSANNQLRNDNLTITQVGTLVILSEAEDGEMTMKELEKALHVAQPTVVGIVKRLEQKDLVHSGGDAGDRRIKIVRITGSGRKSCSKANRIMKETEERLLSGMDQQERQELVRMLKVVLGNLQ